MEHNRDYAKMVSKKVKDYFKKSLGKISVTMTAGTKYPYISLYCMGDTNIDIKIRELALKTIYGNDFECNDKFIAGNISDSRMAMKADEWESLLNNLGEAHE